MSEAPDISVQPASPPNDNSSNRQTVQATDQVVQSGASTAQSFPTPVAFPSVPPPQIPQMAGLMIQAGIGQPQQNPEVMRHITDFLKTDSNNKLSAHESRGRKTHIFRMTALLLGGLLAVLVLMMPLVALARGDMQFVNSFLDKYLQMIIIIALALLGGGKLFEIFK